MLLSREFIHYMAREMVRRLTPKIFEVIQPQEGVAVIARVIEEDLAVEDQLNQEVRDILAQYSDYMRREGIPYHEMFRKIKHMLIKERKIIPASGRDAGDPMKLSREKVNDLSHKIIAAMQRSRLFRLKAAPNDVRLELVREMTALLKLEEKVDQAARAKIRAQKREIPEGSEEWELLHRRYYAEEMKRLGIDLS